MESFRIEVGHKHGVQPGNIVGAIVNESEIDPLAIGRIDIQERFSVVDLRAGIPREVWRSLKKVKISGQELNISKVESTRNPKGGKKRKDEKPRRRPGPRR